MKSIFTQKQSAKFIRLCLLIAVSAVSATVAFSQSGTVFRDFNGNGTKDTNEPLIPGVTVTAYNAAGASCGTAVTSGTTSPNYTISGCGSADVRVEFVLPANGVCVSADGNYSSLNGASYGTSVQFVNGNATNVNFALFDPEDVNEGAAATDVFVPCYVNGDPLAGGTSGSGEWFVGFDYTDNGNSPPGGNAPEKKVNGAVLGATWGVAYSRQSEKIFTSAFMKRHVGLGQMGSGGIYLLTPTASSFTVTQFFDMDNNTFNTAANPTRSRAGAGAPAFGSGSSFNLNGAGTEVTYLGSTDPLTGKPAGLGVVGVNGAAGRNLPANSANTPSRDEAAFDQVGKVGLGDIELSSDGKYLFVMNLYQRKVFRLELDNPANPTAVVAVTSYDVPKPACATGEIRPFALKYAKGKIFAGAVCSGENGGSSTTMSAYVFELNNPTGAAPSFNATPVHTYSLDYTRGFPGGNGEVEVTKWQPWTKNSDVLISNGGNSGYNEGYPSPVLSDIEFSDRGDMIMGFFDRGGHQWGPNNFKNLGGGAVGGYYAAGEILISGVNCTSNSYVLENNGGFTSLNGQTFTSGGANNQGPGNSEFFKGENFNNYHRETAQGGLAILRGSGEVMTIAMDPNAVDEGGVIRLSTTDGSKVGSSSYTLYKGSAGAGLFGKANGLGDIEFTAPVVPLEIGNRVWFDANENGVQDADEIPLDGVDIEIYAADGTTLLGTTTTANGGQWYFNNFNVNQGGANGLLPNTDYVINVATPLNSAGLATYTAFTTQNSTASNGEDALGDSDADAAGVINYTTGPMGANDHSLDIGVTQATTAVCEITLTATPGTCVPATNLYEVTGELTFANAPTTGTLTVSVDGQQQVFNAPFTSPQAYTITGLNSDGASKTVTAVFSAETTCTNTATYTAPASCSLTPVCSVTLTATPGTCVPATNLYEVTGELTFANAPTTGTLTVSVGGQQQVFNAPFTSPQAYTITGLTSDGASKTVTAVFSAETTCTNTATYTAPASCSLTPVCSVTLTATPGTCVPATNLYEVTGELTFANAPTTGTLTVSVDGQDQVFNAPFTSPQAYTITGLTSDGASKTVSAVFSAETTCTNTATYTAPASCVVNCTPPDAGDDVVICLPKTTVNLPDAAAGTTWAAASGNPAAATIDPATGVITGLTATGVYTFSLEQASDPTCKDDMTVTVTNGEAPNVLCNDGSTSVTLEAPANLTNVKWYSMDGTEVGTGNNLIVTSNTGGLADGTEAYYYVGVDGSASGCDVELCCPVKFITQDCCPTPNCVGVTVIKN